MKSPQPAPKSQPAINAADLTKAGTKRKRAPGAGRPFLEDPRVKNLPRITATAHTKLQAIAALNECSLADALEFIIEDVTRRRKKQVTNPPSHS